MISGTVNNDFKPGDIVVYTGFDAKRGEIYSTTPPIFKIIKVDDLSRAWHGDNCIGTANIRLANEFEKKWFRDITNPRKAKLEKLNEQRRIYKKEDDIDDFFNS